MIDIAKRFIAENGENGAADFEIEVYTHYAADDIIKTIDTDLRDMGIPFDNWFRERELYESGEVEEIVGKLGAVGDSVVFDEDGATWFRATQFGDKRDRVLIKSDGNYTYLTPDLAYNERKFRRGYNKIVNVLGSDHQGQVPSLIGASKALGHKHDALMYVLYQMVTLLKSGELMKLSTRAGTFITLRDMIEELGVGVVRFFFAMRSPDAQMTFDWDLAKDTSMDNPVYYVQYAHARCCSLLRKAETEGCAFAGFDGVDLSLLDNPDEQKIIQALGRLPEVVVSAQENLAPHMMTTFLTETAQLFHKFFTQGNKAPSLRFIIADNLALTQARLALATAIKIVLANALSILGIEPMESM